MIKTTKFMDNFYIFDDGMVRQFLIAGEKVALLIDTGFPGCHIRDAVSAVTDLPVNVIMTHGDIDHAGGLTEFGKCRLHKADWKLVSGDIELEPLAEGDVFQCGRHRNLDLYIESQKKLSGLAGGIKTIIPCHHAYPIGPEYIGRNLEDAIAMKNGELPGTPHPEMPCAVYRGRWTEFYGEGEAI